MRKRADRLAAICTIAVVITAPTVMVVASWLDDDAKDRPSSGNRNASGSAAGTTAGGPTPGATPSPTGSAPVTQPYDWLSDDRDVQARDARASDGSAGGTGGGGLRSLSVSKLRPASNGARITKIKRAGSHQVDLSVRSPALASTQRVRLLVPTGWRSNATRTWPVVYAFHGGRDSYVSWTRSTDIESVARRYDVIVAMPEGSNGSYTDWYNYGDGGNPRWESFHVGEVRQLLERNFRAGSARAAMGLSSGAQGAVTYAARHPGMFRYAAAYSGVLSMLSPGIPSLLMYTNSGNGQDPRAIWGDPVLNRANWRMHDPATLAERLRGTTVYVSSGNGARGPLDPADRAPWDLGYVSETQVYRTDLDFVRRARAAGVKVTTNFYGNGSHTWPYWKREMRRNWPAIMRAIGARRL